MSIREDECEPISILYHSCNKPLELIHTDLHGPFRTRTMSGYLHWITFIDDCTSFQAVMFLKAKSEAFEAFKQYKAYAENHLGAKILCM
jgi:hypothetical protein